MYTKVKNTYLLYSIYAGDKYTFSEEDLGLLLSIS